MMFRQADRFNEFRALATASGRGVLNFAFHDRHDIGNRQKLNRT